MLKEKFRKKDLIGIALSVVGAVNVVLAGKSENRAVGQGWTSLFVACVQRRQIMQADVSGRTRVTVSSSAQSTSTQARYCPDGFHHLLLHHAWPHHVGRHTLLARGDALSRR